MAVVQSESKAAILQDADEEKVFQTAFKEGSKVDEAYSADTVSVDLPAKVYYRHTVTGADGTRYNVNSVVDIQQVLDGLDGEDLVAAARFIAKLCGDQTKIKCRDSMAELADGGERFFLLLPSQELLEPGRGEGGSRFSIDKYERIFNKKIGGKTLTDEEAAYLADNREALKAHNAKVDALRAKMAGS